MSLLEIVAFIVSVLGVWLTTARSLWNYPFSLLSVVLYGVIFYQVRLYADMGLQAIFAGTLLYGLRQWRRGRSAGGEVLVTRVRAVEARRTRPAPLADRPRPAGGTGMRLRQAPAGATGMKLRRAPAGAGMRLRQVPA
jgi:hypothetical protein